MGNRATQLDVIRQAMATLQSQAGMSPQARKRGIRALQKAYAHAQQRKD